MEFLSAKPLWNSSKASISIIDDEEKELLAEEEYELSLSLVEIELEDSLAG